RLFTVFTQNFGKLGISGGAAYSGGGATVGNSNHLSSKRSTGFITGLFLLSRLGHRGTGKGFKKVSNTAFQLT
ncbi:hypothetical protein DVA81_18960, partial [Acinetobacter baumannii]